MKSIDNVLLSVFKGLGHSFGALVVMMFLSSPVIGQAWAVLYIDHSLSERRGQPLYKFKKHYPGFHGLLIAVTAILVTLWQYVVAVALFSN